MRLFIAGKASKIAAEKFSTYSWRNKKRGIEVGRQIVVMPLKLGYYTETQYRQLTNSAKPYQRSIKIVIPASTCKCVCSMLLTPPISLSFSLVCDINSACVRNHINRLARGTPTCNEMLMESRYLNVHEQQLFFFGVSRDTSARARERQEESEMEIQCDLFLS